MFTKRAGGNIAESVVYVDTDLLVAGCSTQNKVTYCRVMGYTVIDFINKLTTAMNNRYNATLFILQQAYRHTCLQRC